jgi:hypothetical protein
VTVDVRRVPVSLELRLDLSVPRARGVIRLAAGPQAPIWLTHSSGLPRASSTVFAEPGAFVRVAYRVELGHVMLTTGLDLDASFLRHHLLVDGVGKVGQTPWIQLMPFVGAGFGVL